MKNTWKKTLATLAMSGWLGLNAAQAQTVLDTTPAPTPSAPPAVAADTSDSMAPAAGVGSDWYFQGEFLYLRRDAPRRNLAFDRADGVTVVNTKSLHFDFEPGFRLAIGYQCSATWAVEASFFTTADWSNHQGQGALATPFTPIAGGTVFPGSLFSGFSNFGAGVPSGTSTLALFPFDGATVVFQSYSSQLQNLEVNIRHQVVTNNDFVLHTLFGVRNVHTKDRFDYAATGTTDGIFTSPTVTADYAVETNNDIFDFQVGGDLSYWCNDSLSLGGEAKLGYGWNRARERSAINGAFIGTLGTGGSTPFSAVGVSEHVGGAASMEYGLFANWRATSGCVVRLGYQAMFLTNVALAPQQVDFLLGGNSLLRVDHNGTIFLHGPSAGVEFNW